jgi:hypothetical protein
MERIWWKRKGGSGASEGEKGICGGKRYRTTVKKVGLYVDG